MESLPSLHHSCHLQTLYLSLKHRHSTPFSSLSFLSPPPPPLLTPSSSSSSSSTFRLSRIRASHSPKNHPFHKHQNAFTHVLQSLNPFSSPLLKTACIAAALFLMRLHLNPPALAAATPPPPAPAADSMPENLSEEENSSKIEELRSLVEAKIRERKIDEAIQITDQLIELEPEELDGPLLKAHLCARNGDHSSARSLFEEVLKRDPFCVVALHGLLVATSELKEPTKGLLPRFEEAVKFFESEKRDSEMRDMKLLIAQVKVLEGELSGALKVYEELVEEEPKDFRPYLCQGVVYTMMRKKDEAERQFEKFRALVPEEHHYKDYFEDNANSFLQKLEEREGTAAKR